MNTSWEHITCEVTFTPDGKPQPHAITWRQERLLVIATGRRRDTPDGQHLLSRVQDGRVFELRYHAPYWTARLLTSPPEMV